MDTIEEEIRLPCEKLHRLQREIQLWERRKSTSNRELLSLIGELQHVCCVVRPGRSFLRCMITLLTVAKELHHRIRLNKGFRSDLRWWATFLASWNGKSMMSAAGCSPPVAIITSEASGNWGCGAFSSEGNWFQLAWPKEWLAWHITVKELLPVVISAAIWGNQWWGSTVRCKCDNAAVVAIVKSGTSKEAMVMELVRNLFFILAQFNMWLHIEHIPRVQNGAADALSRNNCASFHFQVPGCNRQPSAIPDELLQLLVHQAPDWTSDSWTALRKFFLRKV